MENQGRLKNCSHPNIHNIHFLGFFCPLGFSPSSQSWQTEANDIMKLFSRNIWREVENYCCALLSSVWQDINHSSAKNCAVLQRSHKRGVSCVMATCRVAGVFFYFSLLWSQIARLWCFFDVIKEHLVLYFMLGSARQQCGYWDKRRKASP